MGTGTLEDEKLSMDESRRLAQHNTVKGEIREEVHAEVTRAADAKVGSDANRVRTLAAGLRDTALDEVAGIERELEVAKGVARISQVIDYIFFLIYTIIVLEIVLEAAGARQGSGFKQFMDGLSAPFLRPFGGLLREFSHGPYELVLSYVMALVVYMILHAAINGLLRLFVYKKTTV